MFSILKNRIKGDDNPTLKVENQDHLVFKKPLRGPFPEGTLKVILGMGCFWGVEKMFWNISGVEMTAVGYSGGTLKNPTYNDVCSSLTGHNEVLMLHYNPDVITFEDILKVFWEGHDPTQGMRQGNDIGSQYRSGIYTYRNKDFDLAQKTKLRYGELLQARGFNRITTEIMQASEFYYAENYHQQYLARNPNGYCGIGGTGVSL